MEKLERSRWDDIPCTLFRPLQGISDDPCVEQWYRGGKDSFRGIRFDDEEKFQYAKIIAAAQGLPIGKINLYGMAAEDKLYHVHAALLDDTILCWSERNDNLFESHGHKLRTSPAMPEEIIRIIANSPEKIQTLAKKLKFPLRE